MVVKLCLGVVDRFPKAKTSLVSEGGGRNSPYLLLQHVVGREHHVHAWLRQLLHSVGCDGALLLSILRVEREGASP